MIGSFPGVSAGRAVRAAALGAALTAASACGARTAPTLPSGSGTPFPEAAAAYTEATTQCRGVRTLSAEIGLSGRAAGQKVRGRILAGFAEPGQVRLEAPAPFGRPVFTLVVSNGSATLVLNRDRRVVRDAPPAELVEALTGAALGPDDLRAAVAGCGLGVDQVSSGQSYPGDWVTLDGAGSRIWLRRIDGAWRLVASSRAALQVRYDGFASGRPASVRLQTTPAQGAATDLTLRLSQVEINGPLDAAAFQADIPADATPLSLDELRTSGPLGSSGDDPALPPGGGSRAATP